MSLRPKPRLQSKSPLQQPTQQQPSKEGTPANTLSIQPHPAPTPHADKKHPPTNNANKKEGCHHDLERWSKSESPTIHKIIEKVQGTNIFCNGATDKCPRTKFKKFRTRLNHSGTVLYSATMFNPDLPTPLSLSLPSNTPRTMFLFFSTVLNNRGSKLWPIYFVQRTVCRMETLGLRG